MTELLLTMSFVVLMFWVLIVRPARKREQQQVNMVAALSPGQRVMTAGGLFGEIVEVSAHEVALEVSPGVVVRFASRAIARVVPAPPEEPGAAEIPSSQHLPADVGGEAPQSTTDASEAAPQQPGSSTSPVA